MSNLIYRILRILEETDFGRYHLNSDNLTEKKLNKIENYKMRKKQRRHIDRSNVKRNKKIVNQS